MSPGLRQAAMARRELIGFAGRESRCDDGETHRLFLEDGNTERLLEHGATCGEG